MTQRRSPQKKKHTQLQTWIGARSAPQMTNCIEQPTDSEIREELVSLPGGEQISFIELRVSKTHYMAMAGSVREGFYARYEEYSDAGRWEATDNELPLDLATRILSEYRDGTETWHSLTAWQRCSIKPLLDQQQEEKEMHESVSIAAKAFGFVWGFLDGIKKK